MRAGLFGLIANAVALLLFAAAGASWMAYAIIFVSAIGGVAMPAINTITSTLTPRNAQGELQGAQASMIAFTLIFSPVLMTQTLKYFANLPVDHVFHTGGAAFLLAGIITAMAIAPFLVGAGINRRAIAETATEAPAAE